MKLTIQVRRELLLTVLATSLFISVGCVRSDAGLIDRNISDLQGSHRYRAEYNLVQIGEPAVEPLISALREETSLGRERIVPVLVRMGEPAVEPLIAILKDQDEDELVRRYALKSLGQIGGIRAWESIIAILKDQNEDEDVRNAAQYVLEKMEAPAVEPLIAMLKDPSPEIRLAAVRALPRFDDARAVESLIAMLKDPSLEVRSATAEALSQIHGARAIEVLVDVLDDKDEDVDTRKLVARHLQSVGWQPNTDETRAVYCTIMQEWDVCIQIGRPAVAPLIDALEDGEGDIEEIVEALGQIGDPRATEPLVAVLRDENVSGIFTEVVVVDALMKVDPRQRAAKAVCDGQSLPSAAPYNFDDLEEARHPVFIYGGDSAFWTYSLPANWLPSVDGIEELQLVVCVKLNEVEVRTCNYEGNHTVTLNTKEYNMSVLEARTGKNVGELTVLGNSPGDCPPSIVDLGTLPLHQEWTVPIPDLNKFIDGLRGYVAPAN